MDTEPLELIQIDLWGQTPISPIGNIYYMGIVDIATRYTRMWPEVLLNSILLLKDN